MMGFKFNIVKVGESIICVFVVRIAVQHADVGGSPTSDVTPDSIDSKEYILYNPHHLEFDDQEFRKIIVTLYREQDRPLPGQTY